MFQEQEEGTAQGKWRLRYIILMVKVNKEQRVPRLEASDNVDLGTSRFGEENSPMTIYSLGSSACEGPLLWRIELTSAAKHS